MAGKRSKFRSGQVIWVANVPDRNGVVKNVPRPLLVVKPDPIDWSSTLCCLCISTDPKNDPSDPAIEMPWDSENGSTTGLYKWCRVVLLWHVLVDQADATVSGVVTDSFLNEVVTKREYALLSRR
jgi:hypothetical protein